MLDPDAAGPGIVTEHDILVSLARGLDPDQERVVDHLRSEIVRLSLRGRSLLAAVVMVDSGRRHLVVCDGGDLVCVLSMREVVRCWTQEGADCALPRLPAEVERSGPSAGWKPSKRTSPPSRAAIDAAKADERQKVLSSVLGF